MNKTPKERCEENSKRRNHLRKMFGYKPTSPILSVEKYFQMFPERTMRYLHEYIAKNKALIGRITHTSRVGEHRRTRLTDIYLTEEGLRKIV